MTSVTQKAPSKGPSKNDGEDQKLIRETLEGNQEAFGKLVAKHHSLLYHMACRVLKNPVEAEDVVQEGFIEAYRHLADFKQQSRFSTWMYTIVLNRIRNILRHSKVLQVYSLDIRRATRDGNYPMEVMEKAPGLDETLHNKMELEAMQRAAKGLPEKYQEIFTLYYFNNYPIAEIAKMLNRPPVTVKVYLHRARKLLYRDLNKASTKRPVVAVAAPIPV
jgi:RNA polymerase sigma-70 factor, ECF subfamily